MVLRRRPLTLLAAALAVILIYHLLRTSLRIRWALTRGAASTLPFSTNYNGGWDLTSSGLGPTASNRTRILVIPSLKRENTSWLHTELPDLPKAIYVSDDRTAEFHPLKNKGHEVMVYLTYIIDHYETLPDIAIFMHSHRRAWHNNDLLENDAALTLSRLSDARVLREGYMNLRCQWDPGCPHWLDPGAENYEARKREQTVIARAWRELFPGATLPERLSQACCAQFAVTKETIRALPVSRYVWFRDWVLRTELGDYMSGRVFEYLWQYIFLREHEVCPDQHVCYCDGYGVCFEGKEEFQKWFEIRWRMSEKRKEYDRWVREDEEFGAMRANGTYEALPEGERPVRPDGGKGERLRIEVTEMIEDLNERRRKALERGLDPSVRALESNRSWREGEGF